MSSKDMEQEGMQPVLIAASVASMIDQFNMPNIRMLSEMGYQVHVACNFRKGNTCDAHRIQGLLETLHRMHVVCHQWDCPRSFWPVTGCVRAYRQLVRLLKRFPFVWLHCQSPIGGALARIAAHEKGIGVIYTAHGFHFYQGAPLKNWLLYYSAEKLLAYWTDVLVTVNQEDEQFARKHLRAKEVRRISGVGIETECFHKQAAAQNPNREREVFCREYRIPKDAKLLLSVGELSRRKNHQAVLKALAGLHRKDVCYLICGQGAMRGKLMRQARKLGIAELVRMPGYQEDVKSLYRNADIFVFPSLQEGLPVALMEAMAAGLPCVASDIRGNRELIDTRGGSLVSLGHTAQMQERLATLLEDQVLRELCGSYNQRKIEAYCLDTVQRQMKDIYSAMGHRDNKGKVKEKLKGCCQEYRHKPEVSVIMAVYQAADGHALKEAVCSICTQSYTDWELLICDDGSGDYTWQLLKQLAASDSRIRLLRLAKNHKAGYARNQCICAARGRFLAVMDADDISAPCRLKRQVDFLKSHLHLSFVGTRGEFFIHKIGDDGECYPFCGRPRAEDFLFSLPYVHASIMFRREALAQVHGYDTCMAAVRTEDYDLLLRMYAAGLYGANLNEVLYYIRRDKDQYRRRKYRYRFHEAYIKYKGFRRLGLMPKGIIYAGKPLLVGLLPVRLVKALQRQYYKTGSYGS